MKKKYTQKQKKNLQNCAHQGYVLQHTETFKLVSFLQKYRHSKKYTKANIYDIAMDSGAMSKCVSFTIIGIKSTIAIAFIWTATRCLDQLIRWLLGRSQQAPPNLDVLMRITSFYIDIYILLRAKKWRYIEVTCIG